MLQGARFHFVCISIVSAGVALVACSSNGSGGGQAVSCSAPGGPASGAADTHCGSDVQAVDQAACSGTASGDDGGMGDDGGSLGGDGGAADAGDVGNCGDPAYGPTMYGQSGADDDCKYDVTWTSTPICRNQPVYFTVIVTKRTDDTPLTGADPYPDVVLDCMHPIPNGPDGPTYRAHAPEVAPGTYVIGPILFDQPGKWVFRFHFRGECLDQSPASPHGHAAFYVNVP